MRNKITSWEDLDNAVERLGMLPYFTNKIPGFSVEENVPESLLWDIENGPWEWKGLITRNLKVAYGKFFNSRAGYISLEWLPHFMNYRRAKSGLQRGSEEERIYKILIENDSLLSKELKNLAGYMTPRKPRRSVNPFENMPELDTPPHTENIRTDSRFESIMTRLQMAGYVVIADFEYLYDRCGNRYGWGVARYTTPEALYGIKPASCSPQQSFGKLLAKLHEDLPSVAPRLIAALV